MLIISFKETYIISFDYFVITETLIAFLLIYGFN